MSPDPRAILEPSAVRLGLVAGDKADALRQCGAVLVDIGAASSAYSDALLEREKSVSTYIGEGVAIPHGTNESREHIERAAIAYLQFPDGVDWDGNEVQVCIAIASRSEEHIDILQSLAAVLMVPESAAALRDASSIDDVIALLSPQASSPPTEGKPVVKALMFYAPEDLRVEDVPEPEVGPGEIKLRVRNCSTCGTDVKIFYNGHQNLSPPRIIGHEIAGEIVAIGDGVEGWEIGARVQVIAAVPCGDCYECNRGWMEVCQNQTSMGYQYNGGFAEYMIVPREVLKVDGLNRIPEGVGFDEASAAEPLACAINAQSILGIENGDTVVVFGAGPIGAMHIRLARANGAGRIFLIDVNDERLKMTADAVHPDEVINGAKVDVVERVKELTGGRGADAIITATAANIAQEQAISMAARNGKISFFGGLPKANPTITCDSNLVHYRQLRIFGANGSAPHHNKAALEMIASGKVPVKDLITEHIALENVLDAFDIVKRGAAIKVTVEP